MGWVAVLLLAVIVMLLVCVYWLGLLSGEPEPRRVLPTSVRYRGPVIDVESRSGLPR